MLVIHGWKVSFKLLSCFVVIIDLRLPLDTIQMTYLHARGSYQL